MGFLLHANPRPLGRAAWNTLRRILRLQLSGPRRNESGDPLVMSTLGGKVEVVTGIFAALFLKKHCGATPAGGGQIISAVEGSGPQRLGEGRT